MASPDGNRSSKPGLAFLLFLWAFFVINRALHPLAIDYSKAPSRKGVAKDGKLKVGLQVSLKGSGDRYSGNRYSAEVVDISSDSVKVHYPDGGFKRYPRKEFDELQVPPPKAGTYEVGTQVNLRGTGARYEGHSYVATVLDISKDTVKVVYPSGGYKRFKTSLFEKLLAPMPNPEAGEYVIGQHVRLQGTGKWYSGKAYYADVVDITDETVKVMYADGTYKRFDKQHFETLLAAKAEKGEEIRELHYLKITPVLMKLVICLLTCDFIALFHKDGWRAGLAECHTGPSVRIFGFLGVVYALGDFLEMSSMGGMDGAAYQILLQSKLVITALMMWAIKGRSAKQTQTQWAALVTLTLGMVIFMTTQSHGNAGKAHKSAGLFAIGMVLMKVMVSCYAAVMSDQSLKKFKNLPLNAQLAQLFLPWLLGSFVLALIFEPRALSSPSAFFGGWNFGTILVTGSFAVKTVLTMTILKTLDSIAKNIGEAMAVLVIYAMQVLMPSFSKTFDVEVFVALSIVIMAVTTYTFVKKDLDEAKKAKQEPKITEVTSDPDGKVARPLGTV
mmetsp:Transcript_73489/g.129705  ORF Transcript_73489/g.129705 Transcript_73489/m.129705 type:complete len:557 (+) Transcript_73489:55-1725(+)|eukprot:CAMPEP_0197648508 /NCGR_PEP_ID=MMETSP1338-20131121/27800_1 /TAXON_ID=43686 ORGANISM="Pelagodinium beii, Strain RCC1491" /NCGR_SAMPLE_ID=MMETSP1338 /ASSEMBLY_ACC=CAM_ASM_000754 /LENGTH=556 /DNA_ID=CAMNT_0043222531 /DNA_START=44 /DNA_END=1714 /DNA_ORIENTATION=+